MVLGKLPAPGRPTIWITVGQGPTALAVGAGGGCLDIFTLICPFSPLSPSLWETARYRLKYCLKGPLKPKTTNQPTILLKPYVVTPHLNRLIETVQMMGHNICFYTELTKIISNYHQILPLISMDTLSKAQIK